MHTQIIEILLVEDNQYDAELALTALQKRHLANSIHHVEDGAEALDFVFARGKYVERVIENGPKVNGIEVLRQVKADERTRKIPVVVLTSSKEDPDISTCYELGVNSYIVKPVDFDNFFKAVEDLGLYWLLLNQPPK